MFGIGLPEMILILALALIVVGPDKLPDLARSMAKGLVELKKTAEGLKASFTEEGNPLDEIRENLEDASKSLKNNLLELPQNKRDETIDATGVYPPEENAKMAYQELLKRTSGAHASAPDAADTTAAADTADTPEVSAPEGTGDTVQKPPEPRQQQDDR
ncbi:twin-arginine translocase TatA/TatE family subunit [Desulfocastanea catecholica]